MLLNVITIQLQTDVRVLKTSDDFVEQMIRFSILYTLSEKYFVLAWNFEWLPERTTVKKPILVDNWYCFGPAHLIIAIYVSN